MSFSSDLTPSVGESVGRRLFSAVNKCSDALDSEAVYFWPLGPYSIDQYVSIRYNKIQYTAIGEPELRLSIISTAGDG